MTATPSRSAGRAWSVALVLLSPFLFWAALAGWLDGLGMARDNRYLADGLDHVAAELVRAEVFRNLVLVLTPAIPLVVAAWVLMRRGSALRPFFALAWGLQASWALLFLGRPRDWRVLRIRADFDVPNLLWSLREAGWRGFLLPTLVLVLAVIAALVLRRRTPSSPPPGRTTIRVALGLALAAALGALLAVLYPSYLAPPVASAGHDVIYVTWDSTRADHLSCYGYERDTTPCLTEFAEDAVLYERAYAQHNWTRPSYMSIMTSRQGWEFVLRKGIDRWRLTMAEALKNAGYRTEAFVQNPNLEYVFRFDQGFDRYVQVHHEERPDRVVDHVERRLDELAADDRPFFLFVHFEQPHWPYEYDGAFAEETALGEAPPLTPDDIRELLHEHDLEAWDHSAPDAAERMRYLLSLYDGDIRDADAALGRLLGLLDERGLLRDSVVVFNSDHGDEFLEHGNFGHAHANLHQELTRIPLVIRYPDALGITPRREAAAAQNLDVFPTVLDAVGLPLPDQLQGRSLLDLGAEEAHERMIISSEGGLIAVRRGNHVLFRNYRFGDSAVAYDMLADPDELSPLADPASIPAFAELQDYADWWGAEIGAHNEGEGLVTPDMPADLQQRLKDLGYY